MTTQAEALARWTEALSEAHQESKIELLIAQATDYSFPAGQASAGIQLATVEVPRLLMQIEGLKAQLASTRSVELKVA